MTVAIVDTTVLVHYFRQHPAARSWVDGQPLRLSISVVTWLEIMQGAGSMAKQADCHALLDRFELVYLTRADQDHAMMLLRQYRLSRGVTINDCLIAAAAHRLRVPLFTHNVRDLLILLDEAQVVQPY